MSLSACTGQFRVHHGKWTVPKGSTAEECTYCEWCVTNGCIQLEEGYTTRHDLHNCLCDCPIKQSHASIQVYNCGGHEDEIGMCMMGTCKACCKQNATPSSAEDYCQACSALFGICEVCGIDRNGRFRIVTTGMLSSQNAENQYQVKASPLVIVDTRTLLREMNVAFRELPSDSGMWFYFYCTDDVHAKLSNHGLVLILDNDDIGY